MALITEDDAGKEGSTYLALAVTVMSSWPLQHSEDSF
jgi:hypothetical protein